MGACNGPRVAVTPASSDVTCASSSPATTHSRLPGAWPGEESMNSGESPHSTETSTSGQGSPSIRGEAVPVNRRHTRSPGRSATMNDARDFCPPPPQGTEGAYRLGSGQRDGDDQRVSLAAATAQARRADATAPEGGGGRGPLGDQGRIKDVERMNPDERRRGSPSRVRLLSGERPDGEESTVERAASAKASRGEAAAAGGHGGC